jgi:hypothetical protein
MGMGSRPDKPRRFKERHEKSWTRTNVAVVAVLACGIMFGCYDFLGLKKLEQNLQVLSSTIVSSDAPAIVKCDPLKSAETVGTPKHVNNVPMGSSTASLQESSRQGYLYTGTSSPRMVQLGSSHLEQVSQASLAKDRPAWLEGVEEWEGKQCIPISKWQLPTYGPSACNLMHEMDMTRHENGFEMINCGSSRCAFRIGDGNNNAAVMKITQMQNQEGYSEENYEDAWRDTIAMERMTASPYVLNVYGSCGASQLTEMGSGGNIHDLIKLARLVRLKKRRLSGRQKGDFIMNAEKRLRVGYHVASGVSAMHSIDDSIMPSLVHNDLCCHQYILVDGVYKLTDFHLASLNLKDKETGQACQEPKWSPNGKVRID